MSPYFFDVFADIKISLRLEIKYHGDRQIGIKEGEEVRIMNQLHQARLR